MCSVLETQEVGAPGVVEYGPLPESAPSGSGEARRSRTVARRRRTLLAAAALAMLLMLALPWGGTGGHSLAVPGAAHGGSLVAGESYVVHQGDTLWGIAERLAGNSDPRPVVARLEVEVGGDEIQPGQVLRLP
jgi:nucleoid-associated protein YgaU